MDTQTGETGKTCGRGQNTWKWQLHYEDLHGCHGDVSLWQSELGRFRNNRKLNLKFGHLGHGPILEEVNTRTNDMMFPWARRGQSLVPTLKANGCRTFPWTVVDSRRTAVSGLYWYQLMLMLWLFSSFRLRLSGNTWTHQKNRCWTPGRRIN